MRSRSGSKAPAHELIEDAYAVEIRVPPGFPMGLATARETGGRIPEDFHTPEGNLRCLMETRSDQ